MSLFIASKCHHQCQLNTVKYSLNTACYSHLLTYVKTITQTIESLLKNEHHVFLIVIGMKRAFPHAVAAIPETLGSDIHSRLRKDMIQLLKLSVLGLSSQLFNLWISGIFVSQKKIGNLMTSLPSASWKVAGFPKNPIPVLVSSTPFSETRFLCPQ